MEAHDCRLTDHAENDESWDLSRSPVRFAAWVCHHGLFLQWLLIGLALNPKLQRVLVKEAPPDVGASDLDSGNV